ncbi:MAG: dihydroorotate dehydrogenase electron transfer subunit [Promethearchaeota archaeon]
MPVTPNSDFRLNKPFLTPILKVIGESPIVKTFIINYSPIPEKIEMHSGQFLMVWIPGCDEVPMSLSHIGPDRQIGISVANVGEATAKLHELKIGDMIGIRGPYGNWYEEKPGTAIIIGGGIGMASVLPLMNSILSHMSQKKAQTESEISKVYLINGAKTESELLFEDEIQEMISDTAIPLESNKVSFEICTDDGSKGFKGFTTKKLEQILQKESYKENITVYACGPEIMLKGVFDICEANNVSLQVSMERMMRCGFGMCGLCALEPTGLLVCKDGPIFGNEILRKTTDFGRYHRDFSGKTFRI